MNSGLVLNNSGTITEAGTSNSADWGIENGSTLNNLSGGIVDMTTSEILFNSGSGNAVNNEAGACSRTRAATRSHRLVAFNNQGGTVAATAGTLSITGGGTDTGGTYNASTGATVRSQQHWRHHAHAYRDIYRQRWRHRRTSWWHHRHRRRRATFNFPAGLFQWTGGTIAGPGRCRTRRHYDRRQWQQGELRPGAQQQRHDHRSGTSNSADWGIETAPLSTISRAASST